MNAADPHEAGAWSCAYLASMGTEKGTPADNSAQLMAGISATLGQDSAHLEEVRRRFARGHAHLEADGIDSTTATLVRLSADRLWLSALLGLPGLDPEIGSDTIRVLRDLTQP
jgi:hypothetical protein